MQVAQLDRLELLDVRSGHDSTARMRVTFPFFSGTGTKASSAVYFELEPGCHLGRHTDSAEEIVLVLEGTLRGSVGDEHGELTPGSAVVIPASVPHDLQNQGSTRARAIGFFASSTVVSVFDDALQPFGRRVVGTPLPVEEDLVPA